MPNKSSNLNIFFAELKRRRVTRLATVYTVVGLGIIEVSDIIGGRFLLPDWTIQFIIIIVIGGFPIAMTLGWIFDISSKGIERTESLTPQQQTSLPPLTWKPSWISVIMFVLLIALTVTYCTVPRPNALGFSKQDWILISDLENNTSDELFNNSLTHALTVTIDQSKHINIFPRNQIKEVLQRMKMDSIDKIDTPIALEIAQRENIKAVLSLTISELGGTYLISTSLLNPYSGETIRSQQVQANGKEEILKAMDKLASKIRKDLGEALNNIHLHSVSLPQATTSSLEALKCLTKGSQAWSIDGQLDEAENLFLNAIDLDPEFALAHASLGSLYYWTNDRKKGEEHFTKALKLSDRLTEKEKLWIEARVETFREKRDEAILKYNVYLRKYPNTFINIATCFGKLKEYQKSIDYYLEAFKLNPKMLTVPNLNHEFGFIYVEMGETNKARDVFEKMLVGNEENKAKGRRSLALLSMYKGNYSDAINYLHESTLIYKTLGYRHIIISVNFTKKKETINKPLSIIRISLIFGKMQMRIYQS